MDIRPPRPRTERTIAVARIVLSVSSLFAVWIDPTEPQQYVSITYFLYVFYVTYSIVLAGAMWNRGSNSSLAIASHIVDIVLISTFQFLTRGPSSPFFTLFTFSLFCAALRWDWRGTLGTAIVVTFSYLLMAVSVTRAFGSSDLEVNRFIIRIVYLAVTAALLVYLGQHEVRLRAEIERLARWPPSGGADPEHVIRTVIAHAANIVGARRVVVLWEAKDEPWINVVDWMPHHLSMTRHGPDEFDPGQHELEGSGVSAAAFETERVSGRATFGDLVDPASERHSIATVVAREIGASLDQLQATAQLRAIAANEQRIAVALDLHDGVLQSLTGIRFELQAIATNLERATSDMMRNRLLAIERALAIEQRELRMFIDDLKPPVHQGEGAGTLAGRLDAMRQRLTLEWKVPVTVRVNPQQVVLPPDLEQAVPLMTHEAIVNALKHAHPSRVSADVAIADGSLSIVVSDDGRGFPFQGRYDHETLTLQGLGPASLRERASALGGQMQIESTGNGSRVEIVVPAEVMEQ